MTPSEDKLVKAVNDMPIDLDVNKDVLVKIIKDLRNRVSNLELVRQFIYGAQVQIRDAGVFIYDSTGVLRISVHFIFTRLPKKFRNYCHIPKECHNNCHILQNLRETLDFRTLC